MKREEKEELFREYWGSMEHLKRLHMKEILKGISHNEFAVIAHCTKNKMAEKEQNGIRVKELVRRMSWTMPAASRLLKNMEEKGLVIRRTDENDRRNTLIFVTEKGLRLYNEQEAYMGEFVLNIIERMGYDDMKKYIELQNKMYESMQAEIASLKSGEQQEKSADLN